MAKSCIAFILELWTLTVGVVSSFVKDHVGILAFVSALTD